jgi:hypothetical protein
MVVVFLDELARAGVELDDFLVGHTSQEFVGEFGVWVEANDVWCFPC